MAGLTQREVLKAFDASARVLALGAGATTLTSKVHSNRPLLLNSAGASITYILPNAVGTGDFFHFIVGVVNTSNYIVEVVSAADTIEGVIVNVDTDDVANTATGFASVVGASDRLTFNGTTQGMARIGDWIELTDIGVAQWVVTGILTGSGGIASAFSEGVS